MDTSNSGPAVSGVVVISSQVLRLAVAAYLARFKGQSRVHTCLLYTSDAADD